MEDSRKPLTDQERLEAKIQDAEKEIASIQFEFDAVVHEAQDVLDKMRPIYMKLEAGPTPLEKQKLREEGEILKGDPLYAKYRATYTDLKDAKKHRDTLMWALEMVKLREALPAASLPETSALETAALLVGDGSTESGSPNSCVSDSTPEWGLDSWWRGLFNMKSKED